MYFWARPSINTVPYTEFENLTPSIGGHDPQGYISPFHYNSSRKYSFITIHPCKKIPYVAPDDALIECDRTNWEGGGGRYYVEGPTPPFSEPVYNVTQW